MDLADIYRIFHPTATVHRTISKPDHNLGHKSSQQYKKNEITSYILSDHNEIKLEINMRKYTNT
jgi:hypothetical protein